MKNEGIESNCSVAFSVKYATETPLRHSLLLDFRILCYRKGYHVLSFPSYF